MNQFIFGNIRFTNFEMTDPWQYCKLVEEDPKDGQLYLLKDNVAKLRKCLSSGAFMKNTPIVFVSIMGAPVTGKSIYTNLLAEYLSKSGMGWTASIKENGLQGFQFGSNGFGTFVPDEEKSGIYFWPQLFRRDHGNGPKLVWIMHVHHRKMKNDNVNRLGQSSLNLLIGITSSAVVDIVWKGEKTCMNKLTESISHQMKNQICLHVVHLIRKIPNEPFSDPSSFPQKEKAFLIQHTMALSGDSDKIRLGILQSQQLAQLFNKVIDETELHPRSLYSDDIKMANFEEFLKNCISRTNDYLVESSSSCEISEAAKPTTFSQRMGAMSSRNFTNAEPSKPTARIVDEKQEVNKNSKDEQIKYSLANRVISSPPPTIPPQLKQNRLGLVRTKRSEEEISSLKTPKDGMPNIQRDEKVSGDKAKKELNQLSPELDINWPLVGQLLHKNLNDWIDRNLKRENIGDIEYVFETSATDIITNQLSNSCSNENVSKENISQFTYFARNEITTKFKGFFVIVQQAISNFCSRIDIQFENTTYFPLSDLRQNIKTTINKIITATERKNIAELIEKGCNKIVPFYEALNERRIIFEKSLSTECSHQIRNFYRDEMERILETEKYYHPDTLKSLHTSLVNQLESVYENSMNTVGDISPEKESLRLNFHNDYEDISKKNKEKIETCHKGVSSLIAKLKSEYEVEMDMFLQNHPEGVKAKKFDETNEKIQADVVTQFRSRITALVKIGEGVEQHVTTLKMHMEKSHGFFKEENQENLMDSENRKQLQRKKDSHVPLVVQPIHTRQNPVVDSVSNKPKLKELPPLLFHLALNKFGFGTLSNGQLQNEIYTTAEVAITKDNKWIYGAEVRNSLHSGNGPHTKVWSLSQCFAQQSNNGTGNYIWTDDFCYLGNWHKVTAEFVLGMLQAMIKSKIEDENEGRLTTIFISIPFWFPSYQRQQVIDAAKIAGFDQAYLVNENSSCAYFMYSSEIHEPQNDTVIISESSHRVDISFYSFDKGRKALLMLGHSGDYEASTSDTKGWYTYLPGYSVLSYLFSVGNKKGEDVAIKRLADLWKLASNRAEKNHYSLMSKKRKVVISCESESWVDILTKVSKKAGILEKDVTIYHSAAIHGMTALCNASGCNFNTNRLIRDGMPYYLNVYPPIGERQVAIRKDDTFALVPKRKHVCKLVADYGSVLVCQENSSGKLPIGHLIINRKPTAFTAFEVTLTRSHEGIIKMEKPHWSMQTFSSTVRRQSFAEEDFQWKPFNLTDGRINILVQLCSDILANSGTSGRISVAKKTVTDKANYILAAVSEGKGNFKNGIVRSLIIKQVNDTLVYAEQLIVNENDIKQKIEFLDNISSNYRL